MPKPITDPHDHALSGASQAAAAEYAIALDAFNYFHGDPVSALKRALKDAPRFVMAHVFKAYLFGLATETGTTKMARGFVEEARALPMTDREASHIAALDHLLAGNWTRAAHHLDRHLMEWPRDILALQAGHNIDFFRADARDLRDRVARLLPDWDESLPGYSSVLGMYAFGLEEAGDYGRAEAFGREAVARDARDSWAHHAVTHVLEMEGRASDGVDWMHARKGYWAHEASFFAVHNWWHLALFHLDLEAVDGALAVYDEELAKSDDPMALNLLDASALLWRLTLGGTDPGNRWHALADMWDTHAPATGYAFNEWHAAMAWLGSGRMDRLDETLAAMAAGNGSEAAGWSRGVGTELINGFAAFWQGDYVRAVDILHPARQISGQFGGSHAQRDVIDWTLTEAAIRGKMPGVATALAHERLALKPHSPINREFLTRAEDIAPAA
ncbi:MAG: tetratricopeptide repeat protein [Rhodobacteraceae bacterium]|nr:tetratricopeptide repeat protein [Paracoccaceae bacterium]